jgi:prepilin peptidase CpaA
MELTLSQAIWFTPFALPLAVWIAMSDLKYMKITNKSVLILLCVFIVVGLIILPPETYLWRFAQAVVVLIVGFIANALRLVGGGDAKYAAAIAPFVAFGDIKLVLMIFAVMVFAALITHRAFRAIGPIRRRTANWASWSAGKDFPMGLALSGTLIGYLLLGLFF